MRVRERLYPVTGDASFECSDERLNTIYAVGRRTVSHQLARQLHRLPDARAAGVDRRLGRAPDGRPHHQHRLAPRPLAPALTASPRADGMLPMAVAGDIEHFDFTIIPDWALHWVHSVHNLYRYVGDRDEIARLLPVVEGVVRWFEPFLDDDGCLVDVFGWLIIDWASVLHRRRERRAQRSVGPRPARVRRDGGVARRRRPGRVGHGAARRAARRVRAAVGRRARGATSTRSSRASAARWRRSTGRRPPSSAGWRRSDRYDRLVEVLTNEDDLDPRDVRRADGPAEPNSELSRRRLPRERASPEPWWDAERDVVRAQPFFRYVVHDALAEAGRADLIPTSASTGTAGRSKRCDTSLDRDLVRRHRQPRLVVDAHARPRARVLGVGPGRARLRRWRASSPSSVRSRGPAARYRARPG